MTYKLVISCRFTSSRNHGIYLRVTKTHTLQIEVMITLMADFQHQEKERSKDV